MFRALVVILALLGSAVAFRPIVVSKVGLSSTQRSIRALCAEPEPKDKKGTWVRQSLSCQLLYFFPSQSQPLIDSFDIFSHT